MMSRTSFYIIIIILYFFLLPGALPVLGAYPAVQQWDTFEIDLSSTQTYANPYLDIEVTAVFSGPGGIEKTVRGFWDGETDFKVRFTPTAIGLWTYSTSSSPSDTGLTVSGALTVTSPGSNRGFVRVDQIHKTKFDYDNGEHYFMIGTTAYGYVSNANDNFTRWKNTVDFYKARGITKVRFNVYPIDYRYYDSASVRAETENNGMKYSVTEPFMVIDSQPDHNRLNISHWQLIDDMIEYLSQQGMIADLIMLTDPRYARSFATTSPYNPAPEDLRYIRYIISRYAAYSNVIWCLLNEYHLITTQPYGLNKPTQDGWNQFWNTMGSIVRNEDPWMRDSGKLRPLSVHGYNDQLFQDETGKYSTDVPYFWFNFTDESWPTFSITEWAWGSTDDFTSPDWSAQRGVIKAVKLQMTPSVNDEAMYVGYVPGWLPNAPGWDSDINRIYMWSTFAAGGYFTFGDSYTTDGRSSIEGTISDRNWGEMNFSSGDYYYLGDMKKAYDEVTILSDFFTTTGIEYWKMLPHNELVPGYSSFNRAYTLAEPGKDYVIYDADGGTFNINLENGNTYTATRFNPKNGTEFNMCSVSGGLQQFSSPPGSDWVFRIVGQPLQPCTLTSAYWTQTGATEGETVDLVVEGLNCDGEELIFEIKENDLFGGPNHPLTQPQNAVFSGSTAPGAWLTEYYIDSGAGNPEYSITATLASDNSITIDSDSIALLTVLEDTELPSIPQNLQAAGLSSIQISLTWDTSSDNVKVSGYTVLRDGIEIAGTNDTVYIDSGLTPETMYTYTVIATDTKGNSSPESTSSSATTGGLPDTTPFDYYCDSDGDLYRSSLISGSCTGGECEPAGCEITPGSDCSDGDQTIHPDAGEVWYDGTDQDCNGKNDYDQDMDGFVDSNWNSEAGGSAPFTGDCNDTDAEINSGTAEIAYDGIDQDCNGADLTDVDNDGHDSMVVCATDCDDSDAAFSPSAADIPYDGIDQDCDGADLTDADNDGYAATVAGGTDCDDTSAFINPHAAETWYDGADQDCDGKNDYDQDMDGFVDSAWNSEAGGSAPGTDDCDDSDAVIHSSTVWYQDFDSDGYGNPAVSLQQCTQPTGHLLDLSDCNDSDQTINPAAVDIPYDGIDQDCSGDDLTDTDNDGYNSTAVGGVDCNDSDPLINPEVWEIAYDGIDQDCSGTDLTDIDIDGFDAPAAGGADCKDNDPSINPAAVDIPYDGVDQDCSGDDLTDADNDGFSSATVYGTCNGTLDEGGVYGQWGWTKSVLEGSNTIDIMTPGINSFNIWVGEPGHLVDSIYLTKGLETPTDLSHGVEISADNCSAVIFSGDETDAQSVDASGWTEGVKSLTVTGNDGNCSTPLSPGNGQFIFAPTGSSDTLIVSGNTSIADVNPLDGATGLVMQRFQIDSNNVDDGTVHLFSIDIVNSGTSTSIMDAKIYLSSISSNEIPLDAVQIGNTGPWNGSGTTVFLNGGTAGDRTATSGTSKYVYVVYDLAAGQSAGTIQSGITEIAVGPPDHVTGNAGFSNLLTIQSCLQTGAIAMLPGQTLSDSPVDLTSIVTESTIANALYTVTEYDHSCDMDPDGTYIEAENYTDTVSQGTGSFMLETSMPGYLGTGYMRLAGASLQTPADCQADPVLEAGLEYQVNFPVAGVYNVWVRGYATDGSSDSIFIGLDGSCNGSLISSNRNNWAWTHSQWTGVNTITVNSPGNHSIHVWIRENNYVLDGIYITKGTETPTDISHGLEVDPNNCSTNLFSGDDTQAQSVDTAGWTDSEKFLKVTADDAVCLTALPATYDTFTYEYISVNRDSLIISNNAAIDSSDPADGDSDIVMQRFQLDSDNLESGDVELVSLDLSDNGIVTDILDTGIYISSTLSSNLPGDAILIGTSGQWNGALKKIPLNGGTAADRTVSSGTSKYIFIMYDLSPGQSGRTIQSGVTEIGVASPDRVIGNAGSSNLLTIQSCIQSGSLSIQDGQTLSGSTIDLTSIVNANSSSGTMYTITEQDICNIDPDGTYIEAESFTGMISQGTGTFVRETSQEGYLGSAYLRSRQDGSINGQCPAIDEGKEYRVNFTVPGTYTVWIRSYASGASSDSLLIGQGGMDGADCDDSNAAVNPEAAENCDSIDNDCNGSTADGSGESAPPNTLQAGVCTGSEQICTAGAWTDDYSSVSSFEASEVTCDSDTYGNAAVNQEACSQPAGYVGDNTDCNDSDPFINPDTYWYPDFDGDGYGNPAISLQQCSELTDFVLDNTDCDDNDYDIYPGGPSVRIESPLSYFPTIQDAYDAAAEGSFIQSKDIIIMETLAFNLNKSVVIEGGYDCSFAATAGNIRISGTMTITEGAVTIDNFSIQ